MTDSNEPLATLRHSEGAAERWATSTERRPVFSVIRAVVDDDGNAVADDDGNEREETVTYTMPARPNPGLALDYLRRARKEGELANAWLIETAVGVEGYDALVDDLIDYDGDAMALLRAIVERIQRVAMGGLDPKA